MNGIQIFKSEEFGQIRTIEINGEPWFVGKDVALSLGYQEATKAARERVNKLLNAHVLYPELDLDFLKKEFVK